MGYSVCRLIETTGKTPNCAGGDLAPSFGMMRWIAQNQVYTPPHSASWGLEEGEKDHTQIDGLMGTRKPVTPSEIGPLT